MSTLDDYTFVCALCGDVKLLDDQAPDERSLVCCWPCKMELDHERGCGHVRPVADVD